ncbi:MsnO8 family LLM class oxidoreductase [Actinoalloteichus spitiensis]|uniref:MsnO8 family LLM class oxidoreductase n=1 Tax=Actinoalloteichus spitiensis TaxID=252394 RepID=UPI00036CE03E
MGFDTVRLSLLDRSRTRTGSPDSRAVWNTVERAGWAERFGYHRFWVAEHHAVPGVAGASPAVLVGAVAARTSRIRVGAGGVMLPNHQPLVVAEQFSTLSALYPGRVDLGLGRSLGFTAPVRRALRRDRDAPDTFADDVAELAGYLSGTGAVTLRPAADEPVPLFVLTGGGGAGLAAEAGLPVVVAGPLLDLDRDPGRTRAVLDGYREAFRPSPRQPRPHVVVSLDVMVADSAAEAADLLLPEAWAMAAARTRGEFPPLEPVADVLARDLTERERRYLEETRAGAIHGDPAQVADHLDRLLALTGADELLASTSTYDRDALRRSDQLLAEIFGKPPVEALPG